MVLDIDLGRVGCYCPHCGKEDFKCSGQALRNHIRSCKLKKSNPAELIRERVHLEINAEAERIKQSHRESLEHGTHLDVLKPVSLLKQRRCSKREPAGNNPAEDNSEEEEEAREAEGGKQLSTTENFST